MQHKRIEPMSPETMKIIVTQTVRRIAVSVSELNGTPSVPEGSFDKKILVSVRSASLIWSNRDRFGHSD